MKDKVRAQREIYDVHYRTIGAVGDPCIYCGVESSTVDHIPPLHYVARLAEYEINDMDLRKYPACRECNSALTGSIITTLKHRREYIIAFMRRKYAKFLRMPQWDEEELSELDQKMADDIRRHEKYARWIKSRVSYYAR